MQGCPGLGKETPASGEGTGCRRQDVVVHDGPDHGRVALQGLQATQACNASAVSAQAGGTERLVRSCKVWHSSCQATGPAVLPLMGAEACMPALCASSCWTPCRGEAAIDMQDGCDRA